MAGIRLKHEWFSYKFIGMSLSVMHLYQDLDFSLLCGIMCVSNS